MLFEVMLTIVMLKVFWKVLFNNSKAFFSWNCGSNNKFFRNL